MGESFMRLGDGRLVVRGDPCEGESFRGFVLRIVDANRLAGLKDFYGSASKQPSQWLRQVDDPLLQSVSAASGASLEALGRLGGTQSSHGFVKWGSLETPFPRRFSGGNNCKVCPGCVAEKGYIRGIWELAILTACPLHGCKLLHDCPACGKPLAWSRRALLHCCREAPFARARTDQADGRSVELARLIALKSEGDMPEPSSRLSEPIRALSGEHAALLILLAGMRLEDGASDDAVFRMRSDPEFAESLVLRAADTLLDWPRGMAAYAAAWDSGEANSVRAVKDLGYLYPRLRTHLRDDAFRFFHEAIWECKLARSPLLSMAQERVNRVQDKMFALTVSKVYGVRPRWLNEWTACGTLERVTIKFGKGVRQQYDRGQVEALLRRLAEHATDESDRPRAARSTLPRSATLGVLISQRQAKQQLGVRFEEIAALYEEGFITGRSESGLLNLAPESLQILLERLVKISSKPSKASGRLLGNGQIIRLNLRTGDDGLLIRLRAVLESRISCRDLGKGKGLARFGICASDLSRIGALEDFARPWARTAEASASLDTSPRTIRTLIANGYLEAVAGGKNAKSNVQSHVSRTSLAAFAQKWVLGSTLIGARQPTTWLYRALERQYGRPILCEDGVYVWPRHVVFGPEAAKASDRPGKSLRGETPADPEAPRTAVP